MVWPQTFWRSQANKAKSVEKKDSDETRSRTRSSTHLHWRVCCHLLPEQIDPIEPRLLHRSKSKKVKQVFFKYSDFLSKDLFQPIHWRLRSSLKAVIKQIWKKKQSQSCQDGLWGQKERRNWELANRTFSLVLFFFESLFLVSVMLRHVLHTKIL